MKSAVYRAWDNSGRLLYVGCSASVIRRIIDHRSTGVWMETVGKITFEWFDTKEAALAAERKAIETEAPAFNRAMVRPNGPLLSETDRAAAIREANRLRQQKHRERSRAKAQIESHEPGANRQMRLLGSDRIIAAAKSHNVHTRTIRRWLAAGKIAL